MSTVRLLVRPAGEYGSPLREENYAALERSWITREIADSALIRRVTSEEGKELVGRRDFEDYSGLAFPWHRGGTRAPSTFTSSRSAAPTAPGWVVWRSTAGQWALTPDSHPTRVIQGGWGRTPTTCNPASIDVVDYPADWCTTAPRDALGSPIQTLTASRTPPDARKYISGYEQLSRHGVGFYPIHRDKSPAVEGKLGRVVTIDPIKIRFWAEHRHYRSFALRILRGCRLMVIDTESPFKHPGKPGPDGEMVLYDLLEEHAITLPSCPMVQTASEGFHRYCLCRSGFVSVRQLASGRE